MPSRSSRSSQSSKVYPQNDPTTYRDLLLFEERLKTTAVSLQKAKARYQLFLFQIILSITFLLAEVLLPPKSSLLSMIYRILLQHLFLNDVDAIHSIILHPYVARGLLCVSVTMLVLFFASGMYAEKIAYANEYVPHANRALRSFNMYFNVRRPPLRSKFLYNPLSFFFAQPTGPSSPVATPSTTTCRSPGSASRPMPTIPPSSNPRGELIISSRVDKSFREAYERYRGGFERKRYEKECMDRRKKWLGRLRFWESIPTSISPVSPPTPCNTSRPPSASATRGRGCGSSRSGTPPQNLDNGIVMKVRGGSGSPVRPSNAVSQAMRERLVTRTGRATAPSMQSYPDLISKE